MKRCADAMLEAEQLDAFRREGQLTVPDLFSAEQIDDALADLGPALGAPAGAGFR